MRAQTLELGKTGQKIRHKGLYKWNPEEVSGVVTAVGVPDEILVPRNNQERSLSPGYTKNSSLTVALRLSSLSKPPPFLP